MIKVKKKGRKKGWWAVSNLTIPLLQRLNLSGIRVSTTSTKDQTLTAENNLQAQAETHREIQAHIFTAAPCPKILVAYGLNPQRTTCK